VVSKYEHTQIGYFLIWVLLICAAITLTLGALNPAHWISFAITVLLLLMIAGFYKLTIKIDNDVLRASFGIGIIRKKVPVAQISACEPIRIRWWYGWGIHFTPYGLLYNVSGWNAVAVTLHNGRRFSLGTDDPHGLVEAIRRFASAR
jgi:hypothetical protein